MRQLEEEVKIKNKKVKKKSEIGKVVVEQVREVEEWWPTLLVVGKSDCRCCFVTKGEGNINQVYTSSKQRKVAINIDQVDQAAALNYPTAPARRDKTIAEVYGRLISKEKSIVGLKQRERKKIV